MVREAVGVDTAAPAPRQVPALTPVAVRGGGHFLAKTLREVSHALESTLSAENTARLPGFLQRLDARGKIIWFLVLLVTVAFVRHIPTLLGLCLFAHALAIATRLPLGFFLRRVWVFVPFFTVVVALPAVINIVTPGRLLVEFIDFGRPLHWGPFYLPERVGISEQGVRGATTLVLRVGVSVSLAILLVTTTHWATLLRAVEALRLPHTFVLILGMTYRYVILFLRCANAMFLAQESRRIGPLAGQQQRRWLAGAGGALLGKSYHLSNEVYLAMLSRGFRGEVRLAEVSAWRRRDWIAAAATLGVAALVLWLDSIQ